MRLATLIAAVMIGISSLAATASADTWVNGYYRAPPGYGCGGYGCR